MSREKFEPQSRIVRIISVEGKSIFVVSEEEKEYHCMGEIDVARIMGDYSDREKKDLSGGESALCIALRLLSQQDSKINDRLEALEKILEAGSEGVKISDPEDKIYTTCKEVNEKANQIEVDIWAGIDWLKRMEEVQVA